MNTEVRDALSVAAEGIDTSFPVLVADRVLRCEIAKADIAPSKGHEDRETLTIKLKTTKECKQTDGKTANAGFPLFKRIGLTPTEATEDKKAYTVEDIRKNLGQLFKAIGGEFLKKQPVMLLDDPSVIEGQVVDVRTGVQKASGNFPESNTVTFVIPS